MVLSLRSQPEPVRREGLFSKRSLDTPVRTAYVSLAIITLDSTVKLNRNIENHLLIAYVP